eukprot:jgi/Phyca11/12492/fgenesh1_pm.PHYCAscaffold_239_\
MVYQFFQSCNQSIALTGSCQGKLDDTTVEKHADLGGFFKGVGTTFKSMDTFAVEYEVSPFLQNMLKKFSLQCDTDKSATGAISYATAKSTFDDAVGINTLVNDLAALTPSSTCQKVIYTDTSISTKNDFTSVTDGFAIVTRGVQDGNVRYMNPPN